MQVRPLGPSQIEASVIAFGAWAIGGWMWGGSDEKEAVEALHAAIDSGITLIDTAPIYGFGLSEIIVGQALKGKRDRVILATKCSMVCNPNRGKLKFRSTGYGVDPNGHIPVHISGHPDSIREEVVASLKRLQTDCIDLYQTHWQDPTTPIAETMGTLLELKKEGKIRAIGVCNATTEQMDEYRDVGQLDSDQESYSMIDRGIERKQLPYAKENGLAVLAYSPLARGLLTGKMGPERQFATGDHRASSPRFGMDNRKRVAALLAELQPLADRHGLTMSQLVLAWTLRQPGLTHVLCGARNRQQAEENARAGDVRLTADELAVISQAQERHSGSIL